MSSEDGEVYLVRRWLEPGREWGDHERVEGWDAIEASESWAQIKLSRIGGDARKALNVELDQGIDLQVRHEASATERRMRVRRVMVPQYDAAYVPWNGQGEERLEPM